MNTALRNARSTGMIHATVVSALLLAPMVSRAQTFFGSGVYGSNAAAYAPNLAFGYQALSQNTGTFNTANGTWALSLNTTGYYNTGIGFEALYSNLTGAGNTANGCEALLRNTTGSANTANGCQTLFTNTTGYDNTATGYQALYLNTSGFANTVDGIGAMTNNTTGSYNTSVGFRSLWANLTGVNNIALGNNAGENITGSNNIAIGHWGLPNESGTIRIGTAGSQTSTYIAGAYGVIASGGVPLCINANGQLGTILSSRRFKNSITDMGSVSDRLMKLRPVTFRYKDSAEKGPHALQYGLIAEEVARVYPDLVQYDKADKPLTVYYHLLVPMLLNEFQKEHRRYDAQKTELTAMKAAHKAELTALKSELASLKQAQGQQLAAVAKLTALVETSQGKAQLQRAAYIKN